MLCLCLEAHLGEDIGLVDTLNHRVVIRLGLVIERRHTFGRILVILLDYLGVREE